MKKYYSKEYVKADNRQHKSDNEFEAKEGIVMSVPKQSIPAGKSSSAKKRIERQRTHHEDPEIDREIQQHGEENVKVVCDSNS